jgi:hypothetical protein
MKRDIRCGSYEEFCFLEYNAMQFAQTEQMFRRNRQLSSSGSMNKPSKEQVKKPELAPVSRWFLAWFIFLP